MTQRGATGRRFYGIAEIAEALGIDRQLATVWRRRSSHGMPRPDDELAAGPLWLAETIEPWIRVTRARLAAESGGHGVSSEQLKTVTRRMLRLAALLLEEPHRRSEIHATVAAVDDLSPQLTSPQPPGSGGDSDPTRRILGEVVEYAGDLRRSPTLQAGSVGPVPDELVVRCLRLVQLLAKAVSRADLD